MSESGQEASDSQERRRRKRRKESPYAVWMEGYVIDLTEIEKDAALLLVEEGEIDMKELFVLLAHEGIKCSTAYNRKDDSYMVTVYRRDSGLPDSGYSLSAYGKTFDRCMAALLVALGNLNDFDIVSINEFRKSKLKEF